MQVREIFASFILFHFLSSKVNGMEFFNMMNPFRKTPEPVPREYPSLSLLLVEDYVKCVVIAHVTISEVLTAIKDLQSSTSDDDTIQAKTALLPFGAPEDDTTQAKTALFPSSTSPTQSSLPSTSDVDTTQVKAALLPSSTSTNQSSSPSTSYVDTTQAKTAIVPSSTSTGQSSSPSMPDAEVALAKTEFLFACPAEDSQQEDLIESSITKKPLFLRYYYYVKDNIAEEDKNKIAKKQLKDRDNKTAKPVQNTENLKGKGKAIEGTHSTHKKFVDNTATNEAITSSNISNTTATKPASAQGRENEEEVMEEIQTEGARNRIKNAHDQEMKNANNEKLAPVDYENNYKCIKEAEPSIINYTEMGHNVPPYIVYLTGYEVHMGTERYEHIYILMPDHIKAKVTKPYYWFNVLTILFDESKLDTRCVSFCQLYAPIESPTGDIHSHIHDYTFGKEKLYKNVNIKQLYTIENQRNVFSKIFENQPEIMKNYFDEEEKYLVEVHLAPLNVFRDNLSTKPVLTYGNIAPMWKVVRTNSWRRVEEFTNKLVTLLGGLHVVTGTYGELTLNSSDPIYLGENGENKILTVPLAFYKIIEYPHTTNESYSMVVVVNNNPYEETGEVICKKTECVSYGFLQLDIQNYEEGKTYCCPLTLEITKLLHIEDRLKIDKVLNLFDYTHNEDFNKLMYGDLDRSTVVNHTVLSTIKMLKEGAKKPKDDDNNNNNNNIENKKNDKIKLIMPKQEDASHNNNNDDDNNNIELI